jgi:HEAT repeat protein
VAAHLLAQHSGDTTLALLEQLADDVEPAVAAQAMQRLLEIAPQRLIARAERSLAHSDARIRYITLAALATGPSPQSIAQIAPRLDDHVVENRVLARRTLLKMAADESLHAAVVEHTTGVLKANAWRGDEQAILILTTLQQRQVGQRLMELLDHSRPEVFVTAAWGLRKLAVPELIEPMFAAAKKISDSIKDQGMAPSDRSIALAQLYEAFGELRYMPAEPLLRLYVPKGLPEPARIAAIWSLGLLLDSRPDAQLAQQLETRLADTSSIPPEMAAVRGMCAITLGRMKSEASLPALRKWYMVHGHNDYVGRCCGWSIERITGEKLPDPDVVPVQQGNWFLLPLIEKP